MASADRNSFDLFDRDPNNINDHVKVAFEDVIAEPDGAHTLVCCWQLIHATFWCFKGCTYNIMTFLCGLPLAIHWGCQFAHITFCHVWHITPCIRAFMINCGCCQKFFGTFVQCFLAPICETMGLCFSNIVVKNV